MLKSVGFCEVYIFPLALRVWLPKNDTLRRGTESARSMCMGSCEGAGPTRRGACTERLNLVILTRRRPVTLQRKDQQSGGKQVSECM